jgi:translocation and assembly module TamB
VNLDFGNDFRVSGRGISTRLAGALVVSGDSLAEPRLVGQIRTIGGEYQAYGQRLDIERGVLRFTGPADNPALDILAVRPRLTQKVGVQVTGTAQAPFVRLYAEPDLPEAEKLSWLMLGRPAAAGGAETALLQSAALALLERRGGGGSGKGPAQLLGLDELGFRRDATEGPAVTLGKRLGRNLYASYERSLSGALGTLYVFYDLSRRVTVRAQAGERAALDLIFTFQYD